MNKQTEEALLLAIEVIDAMEYHEDLIEYDAWRLEKDIDLDKVRNACKAALQNTNPITINTLPIKPLVQQPSFTVSNTTQPYTRPTKPLSDDEIEKVFDNLPNEAVGQSFIHTFARAIEKAHGIGE